MNTKTEIPNPAQLPEADEAGGATPAIAAASKRAFVEPEVSFPVDVLEATTFFQAADSGATNP